MKDKIKSIPYFEYYEDNEELTEKEIELLTSRLCRKNYAGKKMIVTTNPKHGWDIGKNFYDEFEEHVKFQSIIAPITQFEKNNILYHKKALAEQLKKTEIKYSVGIDIGFQDGTTAILFEFKEDGTVWIIGEKSTYKLGEDKITKEMLEQIKALKPDENKKALEILGWSEYDAKVVIDK